MAPLHLKSKSGRSSFNLNAEWEIAPSNDEEFPLEFRSTIQVPSVVDCARPDYDWKSARFHWYRKRFSLEIADSELVFLKICQSQFGTDVWVNRNHAGRSISCYTSHEYNISRFLSPGTDNEVVIRVGRKEDLPKESAVGNDLEKEVYTPGIWGDIVLTVCRNPRISVVQVIPDIRKGMFLAKITIENQTAGEVSGTVTAVVHEKKSGIKASRAVRAPFTVAEGSSATFPVELTIDHPNLWSPDLPFLYELHSMVEVGQRMTDELITTCGLREFRIDGRKFLLNGKRIFLKGGNIAFHRFLADPERAFLPWDRQWIRRALIDIPKEHNFNFFRNHLGQLYPAWYDIADESGMLIQNEWHFWGVTGSEEQIKAEFAQWLRDNWNHPSIIIWDALNECSDDIVQKKIVPEMKKLDPTRPWESVDFVEDHPYIYSLGPVLNKERFGFTRGIPELEESADPVMLNEFVWCWVNKAGEPTRLMDGVTERWLGASANGADLLENQSFLASELVELFRRIRADAIQPFVYLSNNNGPTANWFLGPIAELNPKPILKALKNVFSPLGVSIELWDRHFVTGERRTARVFVLNDEAEMASGTLHYGIADLLGAWLTKHSLEVNIEPGGSTIIECEFRMPDAPGSYFARADLHSARETATSRKIVHAVSSPAPSAELRHARIGVYESETENLEFFRSQGLNAVPLSWDSLSGVDVIVVGEGAVRHEAYNSHRSEIESFLQRGGSLVVLEPEFGLEDEAEIQIGGPLVVQLKKREDKDKGGYDSYVFPEDHEHPVFESLMPEHFRMFNGGFGGEIVSQHDMDIHADHTVLARCGLHLRVCALAEVVVGTGTILVSRIQTRGRLVQGDNASDLYARRVDPVARQYVLNLLSYAVTKSKD